MRIASATQTPAAIAHSTENRIRSGTRLKEPAEAADVYEVIPSGRVELDGAGIPPRICRTDGREA